MVTAQNKQTNNRMRQSWRWFGPQDPVALDHVRQAGAHEIVSALHQFKPGQVWTKEAVADRKAMIEQDNGHRTPLHWTIVESIPIPDDVRRLGKGAKQSIDGLFGTFPQSTNIIGDRNTFNNRPMQGRTMSIVLLDHRFAVCHRFFGPDLTGLELMQSTDDFMRSGLTHVIKRDRILRAKPAPRLAHSVIGLFILSCHHVSHSCCAFDRVIIYKRL